MKSQQLPSYNISPIIYQKEIKLALQSNAGETDPDPQAIIEIQKATISFVQRLVEKAAKRSQLDRQSKLQIEDVLYQLRNTPKYLDSCTKKALTFHLVQKNKKKKKEFDTENQQQNEDQDLEYSEVIEMYKEIDEDYQQ
ncbi:hypothetical protein pb186bvf_013480 [Paramecium bursaria]